MNVQIGQRVIVQLDPTKRSQENVDRWQGRRGVVTGVKKPPSRVELLADATSAPVALWAWEVFPETVTIEEDPY